MKVVAIIPARFSSSRFPGKVIAPIAGKPMIQRVWERARQAESIAEVVVATDDERVAEVVKDFGGQVTMTLPEHESGTERVAEASIKVESDIIVNIQGDEPVIDPESLELLLRPFRNNDSQAMSSLMIPIERYDDFLSPNVVKVVCDDQSDALYFSRSPIPHYREGNQLLAAWRNGGSRPVEFVPPPMKHIGVYAYRTGFLQAVAKTPRTGLETAERLEQLKVLAWGFKIRMVETPHDAVSVDVPEDVEKVERIIRERGL